MSTIQGRSGLSEYPDILTAKDVKDILQIGNNKLYHLLNNGYIKSFKLEPTSRSYRVLKSDLIEYINNSKSTN